MFLGSLSYVRRCVKQEQCFMSQVVRQARGAVIAAMAPPSLALPETLLAC